jgi:hypothetical protein
VICFVQAAQEIQSAIQSAIDKQSKKQAAIADQVSSTTDSRLRTELEGALKNEEHKQKQLQQVQEKFAALTAGEACRQELGATEAASGSCWEPTGG